MKLTITASIHARWGHRVDNLIHTHAWTVEATLEGPLDSKKVYPADGSRENSYRCSRTLVGTLLN